MHLLKTELFSMGYDSALCVHCMLGSLKRAQQELTREMTAATSAYINSKLKLLLHLNLISARGWMQNDKTG